MTNHMDDALRCLGGIETPMMQGDNLAVLLCSHFDNSDQQTNNETGWTEDAVAGCNEVLTAIREYVQAAYTAATAHMVPRVVSEDVERLAQDADECAERLVRSYNFAEDGATVQILHQNATTLRSLASQLAERDRQLAEARKELNVQVQFITEVNERLHAIRDQLPRKEGV